MRFLKTLKYWLLVKASKLAGIDDFSCRKFSHTRQIFNIQMQTAKHT